MNHCLTFFLSFKFLQCSDIKNPSEDHPELNAMLLFLGMVDDEHAAKVIEPNYNLRESPGKDEMYLVDRARYITYIDDNGALSASSDTLKGTLKFMNIGTYNLFVEFYLYETNINNETCKTEGANYYKVGAFTFEIPAYTGSELWKNGTLGYEENSSDNATTSTQTVTAISYNGDYMGTCEFNFRLYARKCLPGEYINYGGIVGPCIECEAGSYCPEGYSKVDCSPGSYSKQAASECTTCPDGEYISTSGNSNCLACPEGTFRSSKYSAIACEACPATTYGNVTSLTTSNCSGLCPAGHACPEGTIDPEPCENGEWSAEGSSICSKCAVGHYGVGTNSNENCTGLCEAGYFCAEGSTSSKSSKCSQNNPLMYCEEGTSAPQQAMDGYFTIGATTSTRTSQEICPTGYKCIGGVLSECTDGTYQDEEGQTECNTCGTCDSDQYLEDCDGSSAGECTSCSITLNNVDSLCVATSVFVQCDGTGTSDESACFLCSNSTLSEGSFNITSSSNATSAQLYSQYESNCLRSTTLTSVTNSGVEPWVIGVSAAGVGSVFIAAIFIVIRKRQQMRRRMDALDRENQSFANEQELAMTMQTNLNPIIARNQNEIDIVQLDAESATAVYREEIEEINSHRMALEEEVRRLKREQQQSTAASVGRDSRLGPTKRQFNDAEGSI